MRIAVGADHAGFALKTQLCDKLRREGHHVVDFGTDSPEPCDYPDFAERVARDVAAGNSEKGILVCYSGLGMSIAANKIPGIRAALGTSPEEVRLARGHNDANILTLGEHFTTEPDAGKLVDVFLHTDFDGGRHLPRIAKISELEAKSQELKAKS
jgi:ribose 5-phosphate isomerase B